MLLGRRFGEARSGDALGRLCLTESRERYRAAACWQHDWMVAHHHRNFVERERSFNFSVFLNLHLSKSFFVFLSADAFSLFHVERYNSLFGRQRESRRRRYDRTLRGQSLNQKHGPYMVPITLGPPDDDADNSSSKSDSNADDSDDGTSNAQTAEDHGERLR